VFQDNLGGVCPAGSATEQGRSWRLVALSPTGDTVATRLPRARVGAPDRSVSRLRWYLAALEHFRQAGIGVVSSADIGQKVGVSAPLVRRDLGYFGQFGRRSQGYDVDELYQSILSVFEVVKERWLAWVGAARLRSDAGAVGQFARHNWRIAAVFDPDPQAVRAGIGSLRVFDLASLPKVVANLKVDAAVLAVKEEQAQAVADRLVKAGIGAILNLTSAPLSVPEGVAVQQADLATQLLLLSYRMGLVAESKGS
jgi:redox-sensing transcriptional repressor